MLPISALITATTAMLTAKFPTATIYKETAPTDFARPSFLVSAGVIDLVPADMESVEVTASVTVDGFVAVDAYHNSDADALQTLMLQLLNIFSAGYLSAGDRCITWVGCKASFQLDPDAAEVTVTYKYLDDRDVAAEDLPAMQDIKINEEVR